MTHKAPSQSDLISDYTDIDAASPPKKHHNKFIKNLVKNVDMAFNYKPGEQDRPLFRFQGVSGGMARKIESKDESAAMFNTMHERRNSMMTE